MGSDKCVFDCVHPWWGGGGNCIASDADTPVCACDPGYAPRDARGRASCVPRLVFVVAYTTIAIVSMGAAARIFWNIIIQCRHLAIRNRDAKKMVIRMRALVSFSVFVIGYGCIGVALAVDAGDTALDDEGFEQIVNIVLLPSLVFASITAAEHWVQCLPSQVLFPESCAQKLRNASDTTSAFVLAGAASGASIAVMGVLSAILDRPLRKFMNLVISCVGVVTVGVVLFVAMQTTRAISKALAEGSESSRTFYIKARTNLWRQAAIVCGVIVCGMVLFAIYGLSEVAGNTPIIIVTVQVVLVDVWMIAFCLSTTLDTTKNKPKVFLGSISSPNLFVGSISPRSGVRIDVPFRTKKADPARILPI